jgi:hypothetical protein
MKKLFLVILASLMVSGCAVRLTPRIPIVTGEIHVGPSGKRYYYSYEDRCRWVRIGPDKKVRKCRRVRVKRYY